MTGSIGSSGFVACLAAAVAAGCYQPVDDGAIKGGVASPPQGSHGSGGHSVALETPPIEIDEQGSTTSDACAPTRAQSADILSTYCAHCHGGGDAGAHQGQPPFDFVLDTPRLKTAVSATVKDPVTMQPVRFFLPGAPLRSRLYVRVASGEMPPPDIVGLPSHPRPTISDLSILYEWIEHCAGVTAGAASPSP
ncbi:MAG TPA: hypothetical protein VNO55_14995 [Polyangia bacterium]|nr:hypothetical protein [Polyangia bacterium]